MTARSNDASRPTATHQPDRQGRHPTTRIGIRYAGAALAVLLILGALWRSAVSPAASWEPLLLVLLPGAIGLGLALLRWWCGPWSAPGRLRVGAAAGGATAALAVEGLGQAVTRHRLFSYPVVAAVGVFAWGVLVLTALALAWWVGRQGRVAQHRAVAAGGLFLIPPIGGLATLLLVLILVVGLAALAVADRGAGLLALALYVPGMGLAGISANVGWPGSSGRGHAYEDNAFLSLGLVCFVAWLAGAMALLATALVPRAAVPPARARTLLVAVGGLAVGVVVLLARGPYAWLTDRWIAMVAPYLVVGVAVFTLASWPRVGRRPPPSPQEVDREDAMRCTGPASTERSRPSLHPGDTSYPARVSSPSLSSRRTRSATISSSISPESTGLQSPARELALRTARPAPRPSEGEPRNRCIAGAPTATSMTRSHCRPQQLRSCWRVAVGPRSGQSRTVSRVAASPRGVVASACV